MIALVDVAFDMVLLDVSDNVRDNFDAEMGNLQKVLEQEIQKILPGCAVIMDLRVIGELLHEKEGQK